MKRLFVLSLLIHLDCASIVFDPCIKNQSLSNSGASKHYLIYQDGTSHSVSIPSAPWTSARTTSEISRIILDEIMGYSTVLIDAPGYSTAVVNWVIGCADPNDPTCKVYDLNNPRYHFTVESWFSAQRWVAALPEKIRPAPVQTLRFSLDDTYYVLREVLESGLNSSGCGLDDYRCYNAKYFEPHKYFDSWQYMIQLLTMEALEPCSTDPDFNPPSSDHFLSVTDDVQGMDRINGASSYSIKCHEDKIWFSPACRENTNLCVPIMVQYSRVIAMQLATFLNIPFALVQVRSIFSASYYKAALKGRFVFGWYTPDDTLINSKGQMPVIITWPRHNELEYNQGIFRTGQTSSHSVNYCWPNLPTVGNSAHLMYFLKGFQLYDSDLTQLMVRNRILKDSVPGMGELKAARTAACEWVLSNADRWRLWVPVTCQPGFYPSPSRTCEPCPPGYVCLGEAPAPCPAGSFCPAGTYEPIRCPLGTEQPSQGAAAPSACTPCRPGFTRIDAALVTCLPCPPGFRCPPNATAPLLCDAGTFTAAVGLLSCSTCPPGTFAKSPGQSACQNCSVGTYQARAGESACEFCPMGSFQPCDGASACDACPFAHAATAAVGSVSARQCGCAAGYFRRCVVADGNQSGGNASCAASDAADYAALGAAALAAFCEACPDGGMFCPGGLARGAHAQPVALPGFSLRAGEPYGSYACDARNTVVCPGGPPGTCGPGFDGEAPSCGACVAGAFRTADGCTECSSGLRGSDVAAVVLAALAWMGLFYWGAGWVDSKGRVFNDLVCAVAISVRALSAAYIITAPVVRAQSSGPTGSLGTFLDSALGQFSMVRPACSMGRSLTARYFAKIGLYCALIAAAWTSHHVRSLLCRNPPHTVSLATMVNFLGLLVSGFYILLSKSVVAIYECRPNPNGRPTMASFPDVLCDSPERAAVLPAAAVLTLVLVAGVPLLFAIAVYLAPSRLPRDGPFAAATRFLFCHYHPDRHHAALTILLRSFLLSLTAMFFPGSVILQTTFYICVLSLAIVNTLITRPYNSGANSVLDATLCLVLMWLALASGANLAVISAATDATAGTGPAPAPLSGLVALEAFSLCFLAVATAAGVAHETVAAVRRIRALPPEKRRSLVVVRVAHRVKKRLAPLRTYVSSRASVSSLDSRFTSKMDPPECDSGSFEISCAPGPPYLALPEDQVRTFNDKAAVISSGQLELPRPVFQRRSSPYKTPASPAPREATLPVTVTVSPGLPTIVVDGSAAAGLVQAVGKASQSTQPPFAAGGKARGADGSMQLEPTEPGFQPAPAQDMRSSCEYKGQALVKCEGDGLVEQICWVEGWEQNSRLGHDSDSEEGARELAGSRDRQTKEGIHPACTAELGDAAVTLLRFNEAEAYQARDGLGRAEDYASLRMRRPRSGLARVLTGPVATQVMPMSARKGRLGRRTGTTEPRPTAEASGSNGTVLAARSAQSLSIGHVRRSRTHQRH